jgi:hypothetical protein
VLTTTVSGASPRNASSAGRSNHGTRRVTVDDYSMSLIVPPTAPASPHGPRWIARPRSTGSQPHPSSRRGPRPRSGVTPRSRSPARPPM